MSDAISMTEISGLSSDSAFKSLLLFFASPFALSVLSFSANDPDLLQKTLKHFSSELNFFLWLMLSSCEMMVGGMCSLLPYGTGIFHYALI